MTSILAPVHIIGASSTGTFFSYGTGTDGSVLRKIGVWAGEWQLRGIRLWFTNATGSSQTYGTPNAGTYKEFEFSAGERISSLSLWGNGAGTRSGGIRFYTTKGNQFFHHMTSWPLKQEYAIDVSSGLCVGVRGRSGDDIDALGFAFLLPIAQSRMIDVRYPTLGLESAGIQLVTIDHFRDENDSFDFSREWANSGTYSTTKASSWSLTAGLESHLTVSVTAGIPEVADVSGEAGWVLSVSSTYLTSHEETDTTEWSRSGTLGPRQWMTFLVSTRRGTIHLPYEATMQITLSTGATFTYPLQGLYTGINYTRIDIKTETGSMDATAASDRSTQVSILQQQDQGVLKRTRISTITASTKRMCYPTPGCAGMDKYEQYGCAKTVGAILHPHHKCIKPIHVNVEPLQDEAVTNDTNIIINELHPIS